MYISETILVLANDIFAFKKAQGALLNTFLNDLRDSRKDRDRPVISWLILISLLILGSSTKFSVDQEKNLSQVTDW